jgi:hypothetical protein
LVFWILGWSELFWANYSPIFATDIIITVDYYCYNDDDDDDDDNNNN